MRLTILVTLRADNRIGQITNEDDISSGTFPCNAVLGIFLTAILKHI